LPPRSCRVAGECRPDLIVRENVPGNADGQLAPPGIGRNRKHLERLGYRVAAGIFSSAETGNTMRRERLFIMAEPLPRVACFDFHPPSSPDQPIAGGAMSSTDGPNSNQPSVKRKLNPIFVEALMRWPTGLSGFERQETAWTRWWLLMPSFQAQAGQDMRRADLRKVHDEPGGGQGFVSGACGGFWGLEGGAVIRSDAFQIRDRVTRHFMRWGAADPEPTPVKWGFLWLADPLTAGYWREDQVARFLAQPDGSSLTGMSLEKVAAPACGCCGDIPRGVVGDRHQIVLHQARHYGVTYWRCEKHVGRNPCCIEGCGKTFAHKDDRDYDTTIMCGRCWRQAPKWMRDRESRVRRLAKRRGWTDQLCRIHHMAWHACQRWIERARSDDPGEVEASATPPPAGMVAELQRLGL
jgi:site-specific DNA-cytosine methylase